MHLVELFLPCQRGDGSEVSHTELQDVVKDLANRFGGATAFTRPPGKGLWKAEGAVEEDRIVIFEVVVTELDRSWWRTYREGLERSLLHERLLVRAHDAKRLVAQVAARRVGRRPE